MAIDVVMPQMGESIAEGTVVRWIKKPGEKVERDEPLRREIASFIECVRARSRPIVTGEHGRRALSLALRIAGAAAEASRA